MLSSRVALVAQVSGADLSIVDPAKASFTLRTRWLTMFDAAHLLANHGGL